MGGISMNYRSWSVHCLGVGVVVGFGAVGGAAGEYAVGFLCGGLWLEGWWWCLWYWVVAHCWVLRQQACCACRCGGCGVLGVSVERPCLFSCVLGTRARLCGCVVWGCGVVVWELYSEREHLEMTGACRILCVWVFVVL